MSFRVGLAAVLVLVTGCGLLLDAAPGPRDAGIDARVRSDDASRADAPREDAPGLDAPEPDAPLDDASPGDGGPDASGPATCACPEIPLGECEQQRCEGTVCVREDDDSLCRDDLGEVCAGGHCVEGCDACEPPTDACATAVCVGRTCVRSVPATCPAGNACSDGVCVRTGPCTDALGHLLGPDRVCRTAPPGSCTAETRCDGSSPDCPIDAPPAPSGTPCGSAAGLCRPPSFCNGLERSCPSAGVLDWDMDSTGEPDCRERGGACTAGGDCVIGSCTGRACVIGCLAGTLDCTTTPPVCVLGTPAIFAPRGTVCAEAVAPCLEARYCTGTAGTCPAAAFLGGTCRPARGPCDLPEHCEPGNVCPPDALAAGDACRPSRDACDQTEVCDGASADCPPDVLAADDTACGGASGCEHCAAGACVRAPFASACTTSMGAGGQCDASGACVDFSGASCAVPGAPCAVGVTDAFGDCVVAGPAPAGTLCSPASSCVAESRCTGVGPSFVCPPPAVGGSCTLDCGMGPMTAPCVGARCPLACAAAS